jgi:hypothetical protein
MQHLKRIVLMALAVTLCTAPASAQAHGSAVVTPSSGPLLGELWAQVYSLPAPENPIFGNGNQCLKLSPRVVEAVEGGPCTARLGTADMIGLGSAWSNVEPPFPTTEADQRAISLSADQLFAEINLVIDHDRPIEIRLPRFELFSPQRTVRLPDDNITGAPAQTVTLTAHGWFALVWFLRPGRHTITQNALLSTGDHQTLTYAVNIRP